MKFIFSAIVNDCQRYLFDNIRRLAVHMKYALIVISNSHKGRLCKNIFFLFQRNIGRIPLKNIPIRNLKIYMRFVVRLGNNYLNGSRYKSHKIFVPIFNSVGKIHEIP